MTDASQSAVPLRGLPAGLPWLIVTLWAATSFMLARNGAFVEPPDALPLRLMAAVMIPVGLFLGAYTLIPAVRTWVAGLDLGLVVAVQTWRVLGIAFVFLWGLGSLPATFAIPAGVGDVAVGVFAVYVTLAVARKTPDWPARVRLLTIVGILDFMLAFGTATLSGEGRLLQLASAPLPVLMQTLPMAMIPTFGVPFFMILHLIAWLKLPVQARTSGAAHP